MDQREVKTVHIDVHSFISSFTNSRPLSIARAPTSQKNANKVKSLGVSAVKKHKFGEMILVRHNVLEFAVRLTLKVDQVNMSKRVKLVRYDW